MRPYDRSFTHDCAPSSYPRRNRRGHRTPHATMISGPSVAEPAPVRSFYAHLGANQGWLVPTFLFGGPRRAFGGRRLRTPARDCERSLLPGLEVFRRALRRIDGSVPSSSNAQSVYDACPATGVPVHCASVRRLPSRQPRAAPSGVEASWEKYFEGRRNVSTVRWPDPDMSCSTPQGRLVCGADRRQKPWSDGLKHRR